MDGSAAAGGLVGVAGIRGAILLLLVLAVPITIYVQVSKSLRILRLPIDQVQPHAGTDRKE